MISFHGRRQFCLLCFQRFTPCHMFSPVIRPGLFLLKHWNTESPHVLLPPQRPAESNCEPDPDNTALSSSSLKSEKSEPN